MEIPVWVEPVEPNVYRALTGEPFGLAAEGASEEEAVEKVRELLAAKIAAGSRLVSVEVPVSNHSWAPWVGMFKDDELSQEWQRAMAERRKQIDEDPDIL